MVDLTLDNRSGAWAVVNSKSHNRPIFDRAAKKALVDADPLVEKTLAEEHALTLEYVRAKVAVSSAPIYSHFALVADDPSVQFVSNAQIAYVRRAMPGTEYSQYPILSAAAPFKAGGRQGWSYCTDIPAGPLAIKHTADLYIYPNTLKAVLLTGARSRSGWRCRRASSIRSTPRVSHSRRWSITRFLPTTSTPLTAFSMTWT